MLKIIDGGKSKFNEADQKLYKEIKKGIEGYDHLREHIEDRDYSKFYLIMAYNLFELGLEKEAIEQIEKMSKEYWTDEFLDDVQLSVDSRNTAVMFGINDAPTDNDEYRDAVMEAEFFIVAADINTYLDSIEFTSKKEFDKILKEFDENTYSFITTTEVASAIKDLCEPVDEGDEEVSEEDN